MRTVFISFVITSCFLGYFLYVGVEKTHERQAICAAKGGTLVKAVKGYVCATVIK